MDNNTFSIPDARDDNATVAALAALSPIAYDRVRVEEAARIGCRVETLDRQVDDARREVAASRKEAAAAQLQSDAAAAPMGQADAAVEIARAAGLDEIAYDQHKREIAARIGITAATLDRQVGAARRAANHDAEDAGADRPPEFSDESLALRFTEKHARDLRYVATWGRWFRWDGVRWAGDDTLDVFNRARAVCRHAAAECNDQRVSSRIAAAQTVAAVERLARADRRHAATVEQWDADPWVLNTPGGVLDLRTGSVRPHSPTDYLTKIATVAPGGECPRWLRFLAEITQNDAELIEYLQRFIGYSLTGSIREHAFAFLWGPGGNGKSVLLGTVAGLLGDYATTAMPDVFTVGRNDQHPTHLAALRGARMVMVTETEEGRRWAEARLKSLTGGDRISARVMRGDPFEFAPVFKLWIAGNHRPGLRNPDPAMRRRLHLLPLTFVPSKPDPELPDALKAEAGGILAWAVKGCIAWQKSGLAQCETVKAATAEYFAEQDLLAEWIGERCETAAGKTTPARAAFTDWKRWATERGEDAGTEKRFSAEMERHFAKQRTKTGREFLGVRLLPTEGGVW